MSGFREQSSFGHAQRLNIRQLTYKVYLDEKHTNVIEFRAVW